MDIPTDTLLVLFRNLFTRQGSWFSAVLLLIYINFPLWMWLVFVAGSKSHRRLLICRPVCVPQHIEEVHPKLQDSRVNSIEVNFHTGWGDEVVATWRHGCRSAKKDLLSLHLRMVACCCNQLLCHCWNGSEIKTASPLAHNLFSFEAHFRFELSDSLIDIGVMAKVEAATY